VKTFSVVQATLVAALLIVCLTSYGLRAYKLVTLPSPHSELNPAPVTPAPADVMSPAAIAQLSLFGARRQEPVTPPPVALDNVPKTKLDFTLNAVFTDSEPARGSAVIATDNNSQAKRYFINEILPGNVILFAIYPDHVILKRGETLEQLAFPRDRTQ